MSNESAKIEDYSHAMLGTTRGSEESVKITGTYHAVLRGARDECYAEYVKLLGRIKWMKRASESFLGKVPFIGKALNAWVERTHAYAESMTEIKWQGDLPNTVTTVGKNYLLDNGLAGSSYTAAFYMGLISSASYSAISAADTMSSHAGWLEAGIANAPTYSEATRRTMAWSSASSGSKALSAGLVFTFTGSGTVKGCFATTVSTKDGTTGTLYSAGLFTGGDQPVVSTNTLTVTYTATLT